MPFVSTSSLSAAIELYRQKIGGMLEVGTLRSILRELFKVELQEFQKIVSKWTLLQMGTWWTWKMIKMSDRIREEQNKQRNKDRRQSTERNACSFSLKEKNEEAIVILPPATNELCVLWLMTSTPQHPTTIEWNGVTNDQRCADRLEIHNTQTHWESSNWGV